MGVGDRIRQRREEKGITAAELARRADIAKSYLSEIESSNASRPSGAVLYRLAEALGTTIADLLEKEVQPVTREVPESLKRFAEEDGLIPEDVEMLSRIRFRGAQPSNSEDWRYLYESIKRSIRG